VNRREGAPAQYVNRELGILAFNARVLAQAADETVPLLERLRFITIVSSNLDEFFEIRVAGLKEGLELGLRDEGYDGRTGAEVLEAVSRETHALVAEQYRLLNQVLLPALAAERIVFPRREEWNAAQRQWIRDYFFRELLPVLTPIGLDPAHPFPRVLNKSLNFAVELEGRDAFGRTSRAAIVQAPRALPRLIRLPAPLAGTAEYAFVFLSSILHAHVSRPRSSDEGQTSTSSSVTAPRATSASPMSSPLVWARASARCTTSGVVRPSCTRISPRRREDAAIAMLCSAPC